MKQGHNYQMQQPPQQQCNQHGQPISYVQQRTQQSSWRYAYYRQNQASMQQYGQREMHPASHAFLMDIYARDMESEAKDMETRAKVSKEEDSQVATILKTKDSSNTKKRPRSDWTFEEDEALSSAVEKKVDDDWESIAKEVPSRTGQQCSQQWHQSLKYREGVLKDKSKLSPEKDSTVVRLQRKIGNNWTAIADELIERLKEQLTEKNEKDLVMEALKKEIESLKEQLAKKNEKDLIIEALTNEITRLKEQLAKNNEKDSVIEALKKEMDQHIAKNNVKKSSGDDGATEKNAPLILKISPATKKNTEESMNKSVQAKVDVEVDPLEADLLANFPLGSKTILVGECYNCDACKEAWFRSYDKACYHESLCQIYRDRITAKAALEKVNKALVERMKSINV